MRYLNNFSKFFEAFQAKDKSTAINNIISYIKSKTGMEFYPYYETFHIKKGDLSLDGQLFLTLKDSIGLRFNWTKSENRNEIHSIDYWLDFTFDENPNYTLELNGNSVVSSLNDIIKFINEPKKLIEDTNKLLKLSNEIEEVTESIINESDIISAQISDFESKLKRARNPEKKAEWQQKIDLLRAKLSETENAVTDSEIILDTKIDKDIKLNIFKTMELFTLQVARGKSNSLVVTGQSGIGKTAVITSTLKSIGLSSGNGYFKATGDISAPGLFQTLFINRHKLIVFDDCDSVFKDKDAVNMLKGALDTYDVREVTNMKKGPSYYTPEDPTDDADLQYRYEQDPNKLPTQFLFDGQIIFISNLSEDEFDKAIISRSLHVDVNLTQKELIERMKEIMISMVPNQPLFKKAEALDYLIELVTTKKTKFDLNIRTLVHAINLRCNDENESTISVGGGNEIIWKLLLKQYLIK